MSRASTVSTQAARKAREFMAKPGKRLNDAEARVIGLFLDRHFPDGNFETKKVVELARPRRSPLHKYFDWKDSTAAEKYRLLQARHLIGCLIVVTDAGRSAPAFVNIRVTPSSSRQYFNTNKAREIPEIWDLMLEEALSSLRSWQKRYSDLKLLTPVYRSIDVVEKQYAKKLKRKVTRGKKDRKVS